MSLESAPDRSYDVPPADERKGKAKAEGDRYLGKPIITHRSTLTRYPAGTRASPRQKNVAGMNYFRRPTCATNLDCAGLKADQVKPIVEVAIKRKEKLETASISRTGN